MTDFDPKNNRYKCFCNKCQATTGVLVVALVELVVLLCNVFVCVFLQEMNLVCVTVGAILTCVGLLVIAGALYAIRARRAVLLLPHLVAQVVVIIVLTIGGCWLMVYISVLVKRANEPKDASDTVSFEEEKVEIRATLLIGALYLVVAGVEIWFCTIVYAAYRFLGDQLSHQRYETANQSAAV